MLDVNMNDKQYRSFIKYAVSTCDSFSLVFEKNKQEYILKELYNSIEEFVLNKKNGWRHPDTGTTFYNADIIYFKCNKWTSGFLQTAYNVLDWNGENFPEELCFYRNGEKWFVCITHEKLLFIYNETKDDIAFLDKEQLKH